MLSVQTSISKCPYCEIGILGITKIHSFVQLEIYSPKYTILAEVKCNNCKRIFDAELYGEMK